MIAVDFRARLRRAPVVDFFVTVARVLTPHAWATIAAASAIAGGLAGAVLIALGKV
jgi:hypothetical protein